MLVCHLTCLIVQTGNGFSFFFFGLLFLFVLRILMNLDFAFFAFLFGHAFENHFQHAGRVNASSQGRKQHLVE